ncbi:hypothetical protein ABZ135_11715 [Streptomyces sp. NPDC006339]|uniref:hypothetical protein n=1 Tax=Streptomyces sp. NPDC006339 TaxID=3156755 RepID=UPI0033AAFBB2
MRDTSELTAAAERFADRLRAAPQSRLQRGAAAEGLALARELAVRAQRLEFPGREPVIMPDAGVFAVADQLVVAATDLAETLRSVPDASDTSDASDAQGVPDGPAGSPEGDLREAVRLVREAEARSGL